MAFLIGSPSGRQPETAVAFAPLDLLTYEITLSQNGRSVPLTGVFRVLSGVEGFDEPASSPQYQATAGILGAAPVGMDLPPREIVIPVLVHATTATAWKSARQDLLAVTNAFRSPTDPDSAYTQITVADKAGRVRYINARHFNPGPVAWGRDTLLPYGAHFLVLHFLADSPEWIQPGGVEIEEWELQASGGGFLGPFFPTTLGAAQVFGAERTVHNPGDLQTFLTWQITGAATSVTATHVTTGRSWTLNSSGLARPLSVVSARGRTKVLDGAAANVWSRLSAPYDLWPLLPGDNQIRVDVAGADTTTRVRAFAESRHLTALL